MPPALLTSHIALQYSPWAILRHEEHCQLYILGYTLCCVVTDETKVVLARQRTIMFACSAQDLLAFTTTSLQYCCNKCSAKLGCWCLHTSSSTKPVSVSTSHSSLCSAALVFMRPIPLTRDGPTPSTRDGQETSYSAVSQVSGCIHQADDALC